jgi:tRNA(Ile)-lysidine synthase
MASEALVIRIKGVVVKEKMFEPGMTVIVAVSGGSDSVGLMVLLNELRADLEMRLHVVHVNHKLRGEASDDDAAFVTDLVKERFVLPCTVLVRDVTEALREKSGSIEERARDVRYRCLKEIACQIGAERIALGHTLNDQAETVLLRLLRGSGTRGLGGMVPVRDRLFVRPLLSTTREEIMNYLHSQRIPFVEDASNCDLRFMRNRVRHELLPLLQARYNRRIVRRLDWTAKILRDDEAYFDDLLDREILPRVVKSSWSTKIVLDVPQLFTYHVAIRRRVLRKVIMRLSLSPYFPTAETIDHLLRLTGEKAGFYTVTGAIQAQRSGHLLILSGGNSPSFVRLLQVPGLTDIPELQASVSVHFIQPSDAKVSYDNPDRALLDADAIMELPSLTVRSRVAGDRFHPYGLKERKSVSRYLLDTKVPRLLRDEIPVLVNSQDILWVIGQRIAHPYRISETTERIVEVIFSRHRTVI